MNTTITTTGGIALDVISYCRSLNPVLAIGGGTWLFPDLPPQPSLYWKQLPDIIGYVPVIRIVPIIKDPNGDIPEDLDTRWRSLPLDPNLLADLGVNSALVEAAIPHDLLPAITTNYQSVGIYIGGTPSYLPFTLGKPNGTLDTIQHLGETTKAVNATHVVRIVRKF